MSQSYWAVLPANIRYHKELTQTAKLLYAEVSALAQSDGFCWATDAYLAETLGCSVATVTRSLRKLRKLGFIRCEKTTNAKGTERHIYCGMFLHEGGMVKNDDTIDDTVTKDDTPTVKNDQTPPATLLKENKKRKNTRARKKTAFCDEATDAAIVAIFDAFCDGDATLRARIDDLCDDRAEKQGRPVDTTRIANGLVNALKRHSAGDHSIMLYLLDKSIDGHWPTVYPLRDWEKAQKPWLELDAAEAAASEPSGVREWRPSDGD